MPSERNTRPYRLGGKRLGANVLEAKRFAGFCEISGFVARPVTGLHACHRNTEAVLIDEGRYEEATALTIFSSGKMRAKAMREAPSTETWTYYQGKGHFRDLEHCRLPC